MNDQKLRSKRIFLVGMPGSGKSTIGKLLAEELHINFIDLDTAIEERELMQITEIFDTRGEDYFRKVESGVLRSIIENEQALVMSTGGGTPCFYDQMKLLNQAGVTIYLRAPVNILIERTAENTKRPLLRDNHSARIQELLQDRESVYLEANHVIEIKDLSKEEKVRTIVDLLSAY